MARFLGSNGRKLPLTGTVFLAVLLLGFSSSLSGQAPAGNRSSSDQSPAEVGAAQTDAVQDAAPRAYTLPPDRAAQATAYARARRWIYFLNFAWSLLALLLVLRWRIAVMLCRWAEAVSRRHILQAAIFAPLCLALLEVADLPAGAARHALAVRYGISIQSWSSWLGDRAKGSLLQFALGILLVWLLYAVIRHSPRRWWFFGWLGSLPILAFAVFLSPWLVDPLFFEFTPLAPAHPVLAAQIERVTARTGEEIPESRMYVMNASSKLNAMNAYVTGLGASRRVVVWDTTLARLSTPEVLSVFSHEMGHYVLGHVRNGVIFAAAMLLAGLFIGSRMFQWAVHRWSSAWGIRGMDDWASLPAFLFVLLLLSFFVTPAANVYSRHIEHQADQYGLEVLHGIVPNASAATARSLQILGEEGLEEVSPSPAVVFWFYSHPPISDRIAFANSYDPWAPDRAPQFVK
jgi:Zn-dependent protease with chaperone function